MEERRSVRLKCKKDPATKPSILSNESCQSLFILQPPHPPSLISSTPKRKKTKSEINRDYRQKLFADPEKAAQYKDACRQYSRRYRANATAEQKQRMKELSRISMVKVRAKKNLSESEVSKPKTRSEEEAKKLATAKATEAKRKWRANRTPQKKVWDNVKRREKRAQKKLEKAAAQRGTVSTQTLSSPSSSQVSSLSVAPEPSPTASEKVDTPTAKRQRLSRARRSMPRDPEKFVDTYSSLRATATPRKKAVFERRELAASTPVFDVGAAVGKKLKSIKGKNDAHSREIRKIILSLYNKCGSLSKASAVLHMDRKTIVNYLKPKVNMRKKKSQEMKTKVQDFFAREAAPLPDKKLVNRAGEAASILQKRVEDYYRQYQEEAGIGATPSMSQFAKCRPKYVRKMSHTRLNQCLCEYCSNCDLKIKALNRLAAQHNKIRHVYHAVALSTCDSGNKMCAYRQCADCGITKLGDVLATLKSHVGQVSWRRWTTKKVRSGGKQLPRKVLETRIGSSTDLIQEFLSEIAFLSGHLFRASWQHRQFMKLYEQRPFPKDLLLMVLDFAENYSCFFQDEIQAAHWYHEQVTVHPVSTYYSCPNCKDGMVNESVIFVSDDLKHDHHAVNAFVVQAVQHLRQTRHLQFGHIVQWCDGCVAQYKSKGPFADVAASHRDFGVRISRCYFGSRHGKGPCDGEAAVVKQNVTSAVKTGRTVIGSANDFFKYCQGSTLAKQPKDGTCHHFVRSFFWLPSDQIDRQRQERAVKTLKGTRMLHSVRSTEVPGVLSVRHLSCFCDNCLVDTGVCLSGDTAGPWTEHTLIPETQPAPLPAPPTPPLLPDPDTSEPAPVSTPDPACAPVQPMLCLQQSAPAPVSEPAPVSQLVPEPAHVAAVPDQNVHNRRRVNLGDFVVVTVLPASGHSSHGKDFVAFVKGLVEDKVLVSFLRKQGNIFVYPDQPDESLVFCSEIKRVLPEPKFDRRGRFSFVF